jgi:hypothetical protein
MKRTPVFALALLSAIGVFGGAGVRGDDPAPAQKKGDPPSPSVGPALKDEECIAAAQAMKAALESGDAAKFSSFIDWNAIVDRATTGLGTPQLRSQIAAGALNSLAKGDGLATQLANQIKGGGSFDFLRLRNQRGRRNALFRVVQNEGAMNYLDMELARRPDGQIKVVDIYPYAAGELMSQTLRRGFIPVVASSSRTFLEKLTTSESDYMKNFDKILAMTNSLNAGRPADTLAAYRTLPASLQKEKTVLLLRLRAAMAVSEPEYAAAIEAMRTNFPRDPALDLIALDGFFMKKQFAEALAGIDRLEKSVGGDPYLGILRANAFSEKGDLKSARKSAEQAVAGLPQNINARWSLVAITLKQKDFAGTLAALKSIDTDFTMEFGDMTKIPDYAEFCKSPQYKDWVEYLKARKK